MDDSHGHKSIVETMDTYGHLFQDGRDETATALDRIFGNRPARGRGRRRRTRPPEAAMAHRKLTVGSSAP